jgi:hypothetical protein
VFGRQSTLFQTDPCSPSPLTPEEFVSDIAAFSEFGKRTAVFEFPDRRFRIPVFVNEFWTSKQRAAHSLHEISYRACFKPQLPRFFISRLTRPGDTVYDPFLGRGTTVIEAALMGRIPLGCDVNPLSRTLVEPRLNPPNYREVVDRLLKIDLTANVDARQDLKAFYHPKTLLAIANLRAYLLRREEANELDGVDAWIRMVAANRLTGHSPGFFSVYTLPPNQAVSVEAQEKINRKRNQRPPERDVVSLILRKTRSLMSKLTLEDRHALLRAAQSAQLITGSSDSTPQIRSGSVHLVVTSPPFLDIVDYESDNWLRCWFTGIDPATVRIRLYKSRDSWREAMTGTFRELERVLVPGGYVAFEVGEVRGGKLPLETLTAPAAVDAGLIPIMVLINDQVFTKTANCWGVDNLRKGTNTNRIVLLRKPI